MAGSLIVPGSIVTGPTLPESVEVLAVVPMGQVVKIIGRGRQTGQTYDPVLTPQQVAMLTAFSVPDDFDDLDEEEQQQVMDQLEDQVLAYDPAILREEIGQLTRLVEHGRLIEDRDIQSKLNKLHSVLTEEGGAAGRDPQRNGH